MDWDKIRKDYPLAYKKFIKKLFDKYESGYISDVMLDINICFCDLVAFFDSVGIEIFITSFADKTFKYKIYWNNRSSWDIQDLGLLLRLEAQDQAVVKAFEIYEKELKNDK